MTASWRREMSKLMLALGAVIGITAGFRVGLRLTNPTTAALVYLLVVLITASTSKLWVAIVVSVTADLCLNYFFMPPFGTFTIADPQNWVALFVFLAVSVIGTRFVEERKQAELARQGEELKSALLASLSHDLKTPLTAIRVAASNLKASWIQERDRDEQSDLILAEVERLNRLFQNILEMARIDAGAIAADLRWVHPAEIFEAARDRVEHTLNHRRVDVESAFDHVVRVDPRLTAAALAHLLENAAHYTPPESPISVTMSVSTDGLSVRVRDHGPGIAPGELSHLFDRFYRGTQARQRVSGTGMGLSIARGMLAAEGGRIWAENCADGGAQFTILVPAESKAATTADQVG